MGSSESSLAGTKADGDRESMQSEDTRVQLEKPKPKVAPKSATLKVLLLGSGESGKSTILKQLKLIHNGPYSDEERDSYKEIIYGNLIGGTQYLLQVMKEKNLDVAQENQLYHRQILDIDVRRMGETLPLTSYEALKSLWGDSNVQEVWKGEDQAAVQDNLRYYYASLDRIFSPDYRPTEQDILHSYLKTTGITEVNFKLGDHANMSVYDTGGQRSERKKWIHCFEKVTGMILPISLGGYDQRLYEDDTVNRMEEDLTLWSALCSSRWFVKTSIFLFLNKSDIFARKIPHSDIKDYFPDYNGQPGDVEAGIQYFKKKFVTMARNTSRTKEREVYVYVTVATNVAMMRVVLADVEGLYYV